MWWFIWLLKRGKGRQHYWRRRWRRRRWILESVHTSWKMKKIKPPHESFMFYTCFTVQWHLLFSLVVLAFNVYRARHIDCKYFHESGEYEHTMAFLHRFDIWFWKWTGVKFVLYTKSHTNTIRKRCRSLKLEYIHRFTWAQFSCAVWIESLNDTYAKIRKKKNGKECEKHFGFDKHLSHRNSAGL